MAGCRAAQANVVVGSIALACMTLAAGCGGSDELNESAPDSTAAGTGGSRVSSGSAGQAGSEAAPPGPVGDEGGKKSAATCAETARLYTIQGDTLSSLLFANPDAGGAAKGDASTISDGWHDFDTVVSNGNGVFYAIDASGDLHWFRKSSGQNVFAEGSGGVVAHGWDAFDAIAGGGDGILYARTPNGELQWHRHLDPYGGTAQWRDDSGEVLGNGFEKYERLVGGNDGVIYAVLPSGELHWYRHADTWNGAAQWADASGATIGHDWNLVEGLTSVGGGILYALDAAGRTTWYRHLDPNEGSSVWTDVGPKVLGEDLSGATGFMGLLSACTLGALPKIPHESLLAWGLHPDASDALRVAGFEEADISQTIGDAAASAGTHDQDGTIEGQPYCAATDLRVKGMSADAIRDLLETMGRLGFVPFYRNPGHDGWPSDEAEHVHAIYAGAHMKRALRDQVRDWLAGKNGLVSHSAYTFYEWSEVSTTRVRKLFFAQNPGLD